MTSADAASRDRDRERMDATFMVKALVEDD
jgi:hypothetical protein